MQQYDDTITVSRSYTPRASDVITRNSGSIYEIRMGDLWEKYFSDMTFGMFKVKFFNGELFAQDGTNRISVRVKTTIRYAQDFETTRAKLRQYMEAVARVFDGYRKASHMFTVEEFCRDAQEALGGEVLGRDFAKALLELFVMDVKIDPTKRDSDRMKFIQARQQGSNKIGMSYRVMNGNYFSCANWMDERLVNCAPNREENEYLGYLPATIGGKQNPVMRLLAVLEIFGLASYEVRGGQNLEIFVRVNDPQKIRSLSEDRRYKNQQLAEIHRRHADAEEMLSVINRISERSTELLSTEDFLAIDALYHDRPLNGKMQARLPRLVEMGIVEHIGRKKYVLARSLYAATGKTGVHTRHVGLDKDTNKALLLKHIRQNNDVGTPFKELQQVLPGLTRGQIQRLMQELKDSHQVYPQGKTSAARWFANV